MMSHRVVVVNAGRTDAAAPVVPPAASPRSAPVQRSAQGGGSCCSACHSAVFATMCGFVLVTSLILGLVFTRQLRDGIASLSAQVGGGLTNGRPGGVVMTNQEERLVVKELLALNAAIDAFGGPHREKTLQKAKRLFEPLDDAKKRRAPRRPAAEASPPVADKNAPPLPTHPRFPTSGSPDTIFVSMASFRDEECGPTVEDLYKKALAPSKVYVGIAEQHDAKDVTCMKQLHECSLDTFCLSDNVRARKVPPKLAKGPTFGRWVTAMLYRGEAYFMMIDSHNRFVPQWDRVIMSMYRGVILNGQSAKPVISHYPLAYEEPAGTGTFNFGNPMSARLCKANWIPSLGYPKLEGVVLSKAPEPTLQPWAAAGFLFANASLLAEVPFDPHLDFLFDGEEILFSVRMWTHGWDMFSPNDNVLYHFYGRAEAKKIWSEVEAAVWAPEQRQSQRRVQYFLGAMAQGKRMVAHDTDDERVVREEDRYGLGRVRSLDAYWVFSGIDMSRRAFNKSWC